MSMNIFEIEEHGILICTKDEMPVINNWYGSDEIEMHGGLSDNM